MADESKPVDPAQEASAQQAAETLAKASEEAGAAAEAESDDESGSEAEDAGTQQPAGTTEGAPKKKKKKGKKKKAKQALGAALAADAAAQVQVDPKKALEGLTPQQIAEFIALNPALANELLGGDASSADKTAAAIEAFKKLKIQDIMTGLASSGKNRKDMASYKFWSTQPVPQFDEPEPKLIEEGPLKIQKIEDIATEPIPLALEPFRWVTMDLSNDSELEEVEKLLYGHYVEDDEAMFRFKYSKELLRW
jgi:glycylpeptide N-tetradecanoyltransferase